MTPEIADATLSTWSPKTLKFSHLNMPTKDIAQSLRFFTDVLGGQLVAEAPAPRIAFRNVDIILRQQDYGATQAHREHPHYAFDIRPDLFASIKQRLEAFGVRTHSPWTRVGTTQSLMYFRDPSGNQFELFCGEGDTGLSLRIGDRAGGDYTIPFSDLVYDELAPQPASSSVAAVPALGFNHITLPCRDLADSKRFLTTMFDGPVTIDLPVHVTVVVGGFELGYGGPMDGGWPRPDAPFPRYAFTISGPELPQLKRKFEHHGVPTSPIALSDSGGPAFLFRDPTGNLFEVIATEDVAGAVADSFGDLAALCYTAWDATGAQV